MNKLAALGFLLLSSTAIAAPWNGSVHHMRATDNTGSAFGNLELAAWYLTNPQYDFSGPSMMTLYLGGHGGITVNASLTEQPTEPGTGGPEDQFNAETWPWRTHFAITDEAVQAYTFATSFGPTAFLPDVNSDVLVGLAIPEPAAPINYVCSWTSGPLLPPEGVFDCQSSTLEMIAFASSPITEPAIGWLFALALLPTWWLTPRERRLPLPLKNRLL